MSNYAVSNLLGEVITIGFTLTALRDDGYLTDEESKFATALIDGLTTSFGEDYLEEFLDSDMFPAIEPPTQAWPDEWTEDDEE